MGRRDLPGLRHEMLQLFQMRLPERVPLVVRRRFQVRLVYELLQC
jgi:hypothetical protein